MSNVMSEARGEMSSKGNMKNESLSCEEWDKRILEKEEAKVRPLAKRSVLEDRAGHCYWRTEHGFCGEWQA